MLFGSAPAPDLLTRYLALLPKGPSIYLPHFDASKHFQLLHRTLRSKPFYK